MYKVKAVGIVGSKNPEQNARDDIADMLRYDNGSVISIEMEKGESTYKYTAIIESECYTKERWTSFMIRTELI